MNIEKQVVNLGVALRLKELDVVQNTSHFVWIFYAGEWVVGNRYYPLPYYDQVAAYTTDELIELLGQNLSALCPSPNGGYVAMAWPWDNMSAEADTPADALGLLLEKVLNQKREVGHEHDRHMATD